MLALLTLLALPGAAHAEDLLLPGWGSPVRYRAEVGISTPDGLMFLGWQNLDARAATTELVVEMSCTGQPDGKGWDVECVLDRVLMGGVAYSDEQAELEQIHAEYVQRLTGARIQVDVGRDGRVLGLDLEGAERVDERMAHILELQRLLLRRAFAPLDLGLPPKGVARPKWKQKGVPLLFELMTAYGTAGSTKLEHTLEGTEGGVARISSFGRGTVASGMDLEVNAGQMVNMIGGGNARFELSTGQVLWREVSVTGELTAESVQLGDTNVYGVVAWAGRIEADGRVQGEQGAEELAR